MMWTLYGMSNSDLYTLTGFGQPYTNYIETKYLEQLTNETLTGTSLEGNVNQDFGRILWMLYNFIAVIVLLNMLIAMMSKSFTDISVGR